MAPAFMQKAIFDLQKNSITLESSKGGGGFGQLQKSKQSGFQVLINSKRASETGNPESTLMLLKQANIKD